MLHAAPVRVNVFAAVEKVSPKSPTEWVKHSKMESLLTFSRHESVFQNSSAMTVRVRLFVNSHIKYLADFILPFVGSYLYLVTCQPVYPSWRIWIRWRESVFGRGCNELVYVVELVFLLPVVVLCFQLPTFQTSFPVFCWKLVWTKLM